MNTCEYCKKNFATAGSLKRHTETSKSCLSGRGKIIHLEKCRYCSAAFTQKSSLKLHDSRCPKKKKKQREEKENILQAKVNKWKKKCKELESKNKELEKQVSEQNGIINGIKIAPEKKTIYNTAIHPKLVNLPINNISALTDEYLIGKVNDGVLTYEKATKGYQGILEVIYDLITHENDEGITERNYVCTDVSRNSFHRLLESKKWKADKGGRYLNNMLDTFQDIMEEYKNKSYNTYSKTSHDSIEWGQVDWERKNIALLYSGIVSREGANLREELVNIIRKEISKKASV